MCKSYHSPPKPHRDWSHRLQSPPAWPARQVKAHRPCAGPPRSQLGPDGASHLACSLSINFILVWGDRRSLCLSDANSIMSWQYLSARALNVPKVWSHFPGVFTAHDISLCHCPHPTSRHTSNHSLEKDHSIMNGVFSHRMNSEVLL